MNREQYKEKSEILYTILLWGIVTVFALSYLSLIFNNNVWTDEIFTMNTLKDNFRDITIGTAMDVHPPLYYYVAKVFYMIFGTSIQVQKVVAIIPMVGLLSLGVIKIRKHFGNRAALLYLLFLGCIPCSMEFAVQLRMYSLAIFCVTACGIYAYEAYLYEEKKPFLLMAVWGVAAAYTHYFAFAAVIIINGLFCISLLLSKRDKLKKWLFTSLGMIIAYLPWLFVFVKQVKSVTQSYWIPEITKETIWGYFKWTFGSGEYSWLLYGYLILLSVCGVANFVSLIRKKEATEKRKDKYAILSMLVPTFTVIGGVVISLCTRPIYREQYVFPALGMLAIFFAVTLRKARIPLIVAISTFLALSGMIQYKECHFQEYESTKLVETEAFFEENLTPDDVIVYNFEAYGYVYQYYFPEEQLVYVGEFDSSKEFNVIWYLETPNCGEFPQSWLDSMGLKMEYRGEFGVEHNLFNLYMVYRNADD